MPRRGQPQGSEGSQEITGGEPEAILTDLDPHLQEAVLAHRAHEPPDRAVSREAQDGRVLIDVIAKLADPHTLVPGLEVVSTIGAVVTGMVAVKDIEDVRGCDGFLWQRVCGGAKLSAANRRVGAEAGAAGKRLQEPVTPNVREHPNVVSFKHATEVRPHLGSSVPESEATSI